MEGSPSLTVTDHAKGILNKAADSVSRNPNFVLALVVAMLVVILILLFYCYSSKKKFQSGQHRLHNLNGGGLNPQWQNGGLDAGNYGPVHRDPTRFHNHPFRHLNRRHTSNDAFVSTPTSRTQKVGNDMVTCPLGSRPYNSGRLGEKTTCVSDDADGSRSPLDDLDDNGISGRCSDGWSPEAIAEAGALSTTGSFAHDSYGEHRLQSMINYSSGAGELTDTGVFGTSHAVSPTAGLF